MEIIIKREEQSFFVIHLILEYIPRNLTIGIEWNNCYCGKVDAREGNGHKKLGVCFEKVNYQQSNP